MNARQQRFVDLYLSDPELNATRAYIGAGYAARGNAAEVSASQLLRNPKVAAEIAEAMEARSKRTRIDADWMLRRLDQEANADIADLYDETGRVKPIREWPLIWRQGLVSAIKSFPEKIGEDDDGKPIYGTAYRLKLASRDKRLEMLGKHVYVSAFREQVDHTSSDGSMSPPSLADFYAARERQGGGAAPKFKD